MARVKAREKDEHQKEVLNAFRHLLKGVTTEDIAFEERLTGDERRDFARFCHETYNNEFFEKIISNLYFPQIMFSIQQAENYEEVTFGRATCNGIQLVRDFFAKYARVYEVEYLKDKDEFDANRSFESVGV